MPRKACCLSFEILYRCYKQELSICQISHSSHLFHAMSCLGAGGILSSASLCGRSRLAPKAKEEGSLGECSRKTFFLGDSGALSS